MMNIVYRPSCISRVESDRNQAAGDVVERTASTDFQRDNAARAIKGFFQHLIQRRFCERNYRKHQRRQMTRFGLVLHDVKVAV